MKHLKNIRVMVHRGRSVRYLKLYLNFVKNCFRRETIYRFNFFVNMFTVVMGYASHILFYYFVYDTGIEQISGWDRYQIYCLLATVWIVDSIFGGVFFFNLIKIPSKVKNYELDGLLTKPVNSVFMLSLRQFNFGLFSGTFFGAAFLIYSLWRGNIRVSAFGILCYLILVMCAVILLFSILFIMVTFSLRFVRIQGLIGMYWTFMDIGKNPHSIYPMALKYGLVFIIPAIVVYNFPVQVLVGNHYLRYLNSVSTLILAIAITAVFLTGSVFYFRKSLRYYYD